MYLRESTDRHHFQLYTWQIRWQMYINLSMFTAWSLPRRRCRIVVDWNIYSITESLEVAVVSHSLSEQTTTHHSRLSCAEMTATAHTQIESHDTITHPPQCITTVLRDNFQFTWELIKTQSVVENITLMIMNCTNAQHMLCAYVFCVTKDPN